MQITAQDIKDNTSLAYYKRGVDYYARGRILEKEIADMVDESDGEIYTNIASMVRGSGGHIYEQDIDIFVENDAVVIEASCSCPVGYNCKHVAAVCIEYRTEMAANTIRLHQGKIKEIDASTLLDKWLYTLKEDNGKEVSVAKNDYFLTYRLDGVKSYDRNKLFVYKSKFLKNGSISRGTKLDASKAIHDYSYRELKTEQDKDILKMSAAFLSDGWNPQMEVLSGTLGNVLVKKVVATSRCYFEYNAQPLTMLDTVLKVEFAFKLYKGEYSLKSNIDKQELRVLETNPPFVIDTQANTIQELDIDMKLYKQMLVAPKVPKESIASVYAKVAQKLPSLHIATPKALKIKKVKVTPQPFLHLEYIQEDGAKSFNAMRLEFLYDSYKVQYLPQTEISSFFDNDIKIEIQRDLHFENQTKKRLESFGFYVEVDKKDIVIKLQEKERQAQHQNWKE